jgi:hypothetical protein
MRQEKSGATPSKKLKNTSVGGDQIRWIDNKTTASYTFGPFINTHIVGMDSQSA